VGVGDGFLAARRMHLRTEYRGPVGEALVVEAQDLRRGLHDHAHLVVVLAARQTGPVRGGADLDEQDRGLGQRWYLVRRLLASRAPLTPSNPGDLR